MAFRRYIVYPLIVLLSAVSVGAGLFLLADRFLPEIIENRIVSILEKDAGISDITLNLRGLGLEGADLGPLILGAPQNPALVIRSLHLDYSPGGLYRGRVKNIVASGVELHAEFKDGKAGLRGFDLAELSGRFEAAAPQDNVSGNASFSFLPQRIEINSATLLFERNGQIHRIPFEMVAMKGVGTAAIINLLLDLYPEGQAVKISALMDLEQNRLTTQLSAQQLYLSRFGDLFESAVGFRISGNAVVTVDAEFMLNPFSISALHGRLKGSAVTVGYGKFQFRYLSGPQQNENALLIDFERFKEPEWRVKLPGFFVEAPVVARIAGMAATVHPHDDGYDISGNLKLSFKPSDAEESVPVRFDNPFDIPFQFSSRYAQSDAWEFDLSGSAGEEDERSGVGLDYEQFHIVARSPEVALTGSSREGHISAAFKLKVPEVRISSPQVNISFPQLLLSGETRIGDDGDRDITTSTFELKMPGGKLTSNTFRVEAEHLTAGCTLQINGAGVRRAEGHVTFDGGRLTDADGSIELAQAKGKIPLEFPTAPLEKKGRVEIGSVRFKARKLGSVGMNLKQTISGLSFGGDLTTPLLPELSATFSGEMLSQFLENNETRVHFEIVYPETAPEIDLAKLFPTAEGFTFRGELIEKGDLVISKESLSATATVHIRDGNLEHYGNEVSIEGIQMDLSIPDLVNMYSAPGQQLKFTHVSLGEMNIENAAIDFQIESPQSILVEKSRFSWCDGNVEAPAIRFVSGTQDYDLILYCDRLNLAEVLRQFGMVNEKAEGSLNGRIPIRYRNGKLSFTDGFLYTTPGESGKIRMMNTEMLTAGIPPDTPQYVQMELARKALEDYDYSWAKLNLTTEGEELLIKMQLDGKPAKALPFVYQKDLGGFAKVEADVQGSTFQGIRLDVNFRLPLDKIMEYRELIQLIQENRE